MEASRTATLRVKRKPSEEPAEALVLACKRFRRDAGESAVQETPPRGSVENSREKCLPVGGHHMLPGGPGPAAPARSAPTPGHPSVYPPQELLPERLTISEDGPSVGHREEEKDDYVYDIYYLETATPGWIEKDLSVQPLSQEWELVDDGKQLEDVDEEEDEDDENSENNWRNEYPEEESSDGDEDSRGSDECDSLSEEERGNSRPHMWSKYPLYAQEEFGYDSTYDLAWD
uniref:Probable RNA polymerase II nuclear localization protein SLC7A6OS n=2 Tax=Myotis myotis TaxID=51298 RepID=A0A7J7VYJ5_MYOMY|nr:hypothetical protein mMyoMyo1_012252 [Myotis myotis]